MWASAFESLAHPGRGEQVWLKTVIDKLDAAADDAGKPPKVVDRAFFARRYRVKLTETKRIFVTLLSRLYEQIYRARNDVLHGNPVRESKLYAFGRGDRPSLFELAPLIYRFAVLSMFPLPERHLRTIMADINQEMYAWRVQQAVLEAAGASP